MKIYECGICGNTHDEAKGGAFDGLGEDWCCSICGAPKESFSVQGGETKVAAAKSTADSDVYTCPVCGNTYDEGSEAIAFAVLPEDWECTVCGSPKSVFAAADGSPAPTAPKAEPSTEKPEAAPEKPPVEENPVAAPQKSAPEPPKKERAPIGACIYVCPVCGNTYDEGSETCTFGELPDDWECSICGSPKMSFKLEGGTEITVEIKETARPAYEEQNPLAYPKDYFRSGDDMERHMALIHEMAATGRSLSEPMRTRIHVPGFDDIVFLGAQLASFPLDEDEPVKTHTVIGKNAAKPLVIDSPVFVTHMSYGALSAEIKTALAKGSAAAGTAIGSGEGGILPAEMAAAHKYIFEYVPNLYGVDDKNLKKADAIEIKIGQGTKPGMGGHLPGNKVTEEIARVRGKQPGEDILSPAKFGDINSKDDLKKLVTSLKKRSGGRPVGIKLAAGHIEEDLDVALFAQPDFITMDGRGGGTGSSPKFLKDASTIPTVYALHRARKYINEHAPDVSLIITGGLRTSGDMAKALCMGADAVAIGTAALMAASCMQYRVCDRGTCPTGSLTQDPELRAALDVEAAAKRTENFLNVITNELMAFARAAGKRDVHELSLYDIRTLSSEISSYTDVEHV